jgi:hypothetical protein
MKREKRREILEAVGLVSVVASLIFLALEIRQNTTVVSGQSINELYDAIREVDLVAFADPDLTRITRHTAANLAGLTPAERAQYSQYLILMIEIWDRAINREIGGLIAEEDVSGWHLYFEDFVQRHVTEEIWQEIRWNRVTPELHERVAVALSNQP